MSQTISVSIACFDDAITQLLSLEQNVNDLLIDIQKMPFASGSYVSRGRCASAMNAISGTELTSMITTLSELIGKTNSLLQNAKGQYEAMDNSVAKELS